MKTISEVKQEFELAKGDREKLYLQYADDTRQGVKNLIQKYKRADRQLQLEYERLEMMSTYEKMHEKEGLICGIDEAGRGPLAGPVVAAAVILPKDCKILYLNDSKKLTAKRRDSLFDEIQEKAIAV